TYRSEARTQPPSSAAVDAQAEGQRNPLQDQVDRLVGECCREPACGERAIGVSQADLDVVPPSEREHDVTQGRAVEGENAAGPRQLARDVDPASQRDAVVGIEPSQIPGLEQESGLGIRWSIMCDR